MTKPLLALVLLTKLTVTGSISVFIFTGYGVVTTQAFCKGDFLLDYHGKLVCAEEAADRKEREYLYFFEYGRKEYWLVDLFHEYCKLLLLVDS